MRCFTFSPSCIETSTLTGSLCSASVHAKPSIFKNYCRTNTHSIAFDTYTPSSHIPKHHRNIFSWRTQHHKIDPHVLLSLVDNTFFFHDTCTGVLRWLRLGLAYNMMESEEMCHTVINPRELFEIEQGNCTCSCRGLSSTVCCHHYLLLGLQCIVEEVAA